MMEKPNQSSRRNFLKILTGGVLAGNAFNSKSSEAKTNNLAGPENNVKEDKGKYLEVFEKASKKLEKEFEILGNDYLAKLNFVISIFNAKDRDLNLETDELVEETKLLLKRIESFIIGFKNGFESIEKNYNDNLTAESKLKIKRGIDVHQNKYNYFNNEFNLLLKQLQKKGYKLKNIYNNMEVESEYGNPII